jgi:uncharacterized phiE125 gp8 family phage protein
MSVLTLADAKTYLNITVATYDAELQTFIDAAEAAISQWVGPLAPVSVTKRVPGCAWNLWLPVYPAVSLTSVTVVGSATPLTLADLHLEQDSGGVSYNGGSFFSASAYDVVYQAGRSSVPADLLMAVKELLREMWESQRGAAAPYLLTIKVEELIAPYTQVGFA